MLPQWLSGGVAPTMHSIAYNIPASLFESNYLMGHMAWT
jgi:hypothetical protein